MKVEILNTPADTSILAIDSSLFTGTYKTGLADSGTYDVRFSPSPTLSDSGYVAKTFSNVILSNGGLVTIDAKLSKRPTGIEENVASYHLFHVYPNPTYNSATISIDQSLLNNSHHLRLLITDALGRTVRQIAGINQGIITLSRNGITNGSYSIQLIDETKKIAETTIVFQ